MKWNKQILEVWEYCIILYANLYYSNKISQNLEKICSFKYSICFSFWFDTQSKLLKKL